MQLTVRLSKSIYLLLGIILFLFVLPAAHAHAASSTYCKPSSDGKTYTCDTSLVNVQNCSAGSGSQTVCNGIPSGTGISCSADSDPIFGGGGQRCQIPDTSVDNGGGSEQGAQFGAWLAQIVYVFTVGLGSVVLALAAIVLNFAVNISLDSAAYGLDFVSTGWTMVRDIANMAFIFMLVFIALQVMFQAQTHGTVERLVKVLAVALIINFSFFATRVVIDAGNLISVQFYNAIVSTSTPNQNITAIANSPIGQINAAPGGAPDLTKDIMGGINFISGLDSSSFSVAAAAHGADFGSNFVESLITFSFVYIVLGAALFILAAAFITAGVKFIIRIVMLWLSIITAPLALVSWSFGSGGHGGGGGAHPHGNLLTFSGWSKNLINHAFYPAVFLFVLLLISKFMSVQGAGGLGGGLIQDSLQGGGWQIIPTLANIIVRLGFVIVMLYFALRADSYFEVAGSKVAERIGNTFSLGGLTGYRQRLDWVNNAVGPKRWAAAPDYALKNSEIGNTLVGYKLRQAVTKPLSELKLKDMENRPEYVKRSEKEEKERVENLKHVLEHKSGSKAEAKAQKEFEEKYEGGKQGFDAHMEQLTGRLEEQQKETNRLAQEQLALSRESFKAMSDAEKTNYDARVKAHNAAVKANKTEVTNTQNIIKTLKGMGSRIVEAHDKQHAQEFAIKLMSSKNGVKYAAGKAAFMGKSKEAKLADAAKEAAKGDDDDHAETPPAAGGGTTPPAAGGGGEHH